MRKVLVIGIFGLLCVFAVGRNTVADGSALVGAHDRGSSSEDTGIRVAWGSTPITIGTPMTGRLEPGDETLTSGEFLDRYGLSGTAGQTFTITMESAEIDTYLMIRGNGLRLDNNDVSAGNTNSQLQVYLPADGTYQILATSFASGEVGSYTLLIQEGTLVPIEAPAEIPPATAIAWGIPTIGNLAPGDALLEAGAFADTYSFEGRAGQRVTITLQSHDFDPYLALVGPNNFQTANDDSPGLGLNSRLSLMLPADGIYQIQASAYAPGLVGVYTLTLIEETEGVPATGPISLTVGSSIDGDLGPGDLQLDSGEYYDRYPYQGMAGERLVISMQSVEFDPYLMIRGPNGYAQDNDDVAEGVLNSELRVTLPEAGAYGIYATSYSPGETGQYQITTQSQGEFELALSTIESGQTIEGTLVQTDPVRAGGQYYQTYQFEGRSGQRAIIHMTSDQIDPYLELTAREGYAEANDDISQSDTNSRLDVTLPVDGTYEIRASTYWSGQIGPYRLSFSLTDGREVTPMPRPMPVPTPAAIPAPTPSPGPSPAPTPPPGPSPTPTPSPMLEPTPVPVPTPTPPPVAAPAPGPAPVPAPPHGGPLNIGVPVAGELTHGDERLSSGEFVDYFTYRGTRGQGLTLTLTSSQFDAYLLVRGPGDFTEDNDDGYGIGLNSMLEMGLPADGEYQIGVTTYSPGETGAYMLSLIEGTAVTRSATGRIYAVLAGISNYGGDDDLAYCAEDAIKLHQTLDKTGLLAPESRILVNGQVTRANLQANFQQVARAAGPNDVFLFFYSGHGNQLATMGANELDGREESLTLVDGSELTDDEMAAWFDQVNSRLSLIALDSCHAGGFARDVISAPNRLGLFSSEEDVTSNVADRFQSGGYLSYFLRTGLEGAADTDPIDGIITVGELTQYLRRQWAAHVSAERVETSEHHGTYQNLVIDRGTVKVTDVLVYPPG